MLDLRVFRARKIYSDGRHNAFTTMVRWNGAVYIAFRSAVNHMTFDGEITVLRSDDMEHWSVVQSVSQEGWDFRDPRLIVVGNRLALYIMARTPNGKQAWVAFSEDGKRFSKPMALEGIECLWSIVKFQDEWIGSSYVSKGDIYAPSLYTSKDGLNWEKRFDFPFPGNETALDVDASGKLYAVVRDSCCIPRGVPTFCVLEPPYTTLPTCSIQNECCYRVLPIQLQGIAIRRLENDGTVLIGRCWDRSGKGHYRANLRTEILYLPDHGDIQSITRLPSGGDTSYASWLDLAPGRAMLSYYSAHEHRMDYSFEEEAAGPQDSAEHTTAADIYLADISYRCTPATGK